MKKIVLFTAITAFVYACAEQSKGNTIVEGEIKGLKQGTLYIQKLENNQLITIDSAVVTKQSTFKTSFDLSEPEVLYLTLNRGTTISEDNYILFFAEKGKININSTLEQFSHDAVVSGSKSHTALKKYTDSKKQWLERKNNLIKDQLIASKNKQIHKADSLHKLLINNEQRILLNAMHFGLKNPESVASAYITLTDVLPFSDKYLDTIYNSLTPEVKNHKYGKFLAEYLKQKDTKIESSR